MSPTVTSPLPTHDSGSLQQKAEASTKSLHALSSHVHNQHLLTVTHDLTLWTGWQPLHTRLSSNSSSLLTQPGNHVTTSPGSSLSFSLRCCQGLISTQSPLLSSSYSTPSCCQLRLQNLLEDHSTYEILLLGERGAGASLSPESLSS